MRQCLIDPGEEHADQAGNHAWIHLTSLCCKAAGGDEGTTHATASAWGLLYAAAHLLDDIQDDDDPDPWWKPLGIGAAINTATGLIFTAWHLLQRLHEDGVPVERAQRVTQDFCRTILHMGSAQHADLTGADPSLEGTWRIAEAKTGAFFALACSAGASLAGIDDECIAHYSSFGLALGMMIQIGDDLHDLSQDAEGCLASFEKRRWSLPVAYFMHMATNEDRARLQSVTADPEPGRSFQEMIVESGARLYLMAKAEEQRFKALHSLENAGALQSAKAELELLLDRAAIAR